MHLRQDEFDLLKRTYKEMADTLHRENRLKLDAQANEDRPKADSAQQVHLHTMEELFATIRTEQEVLVRSRNL